MHYVSLGSGIYCITSGPTYHFYNNKQAIIKTMLVLVVYSYSIVFLRFFTQTPVTASTTFMLANNVNYRN